MAQKGDVEMNKIRQNSYGFLIPITISIFLVLMTITSGLSESQNLTIISEEIRLDNPNKMNLPNGLSDLDEKNNFLISQTENFYGVKSIENQKLGFKLYDKDYRLVWDKTFDDRKFDYIGVKISKTGKIVVFTLGKLQDLGPFFKGIEIYEKSLLSGYKKMGRVDFVSFSEQLVIDESEKRIVATGYFPNVKESKDLKLACLSLDGITVWQNKTSIEGSDAGLYSSGDLSTFLLVSDLPHPAGEIATIFDHNGTELGSINRDSSIKAAICENGETLAIASGQSIEIFSTQPFKKKLDVQINELADVDRITHILSLGISGNGGFIAIVFGVQTENVNKKMFLLIDEGGNKIAVALLPAEITAVKDIQFLSDGIFKISSYEKIWKVSLESAN